MKEFSWKDVRVHRFQDAVMGADYTLTLVHLPTGLRVTGSGHGEEFRVRDPLMSKLAEMVEESGR